MFSFSTLVERLRINIGHKVINRMNDVGVGSDAVIVYLDRWIDQHIDNMSNLEMIEELSKADEQLRSEGHQHD